MTDGSKDMFIRKSSIVVFIAFRLSVHLASAQYWSSSNGMADINISMDWMEGNLELREDQKTLITNISAKYTIRLDSIRSGNTDRFTRYQKMHQLKRQRDNELKSVLTRKQFIAYQKQQRLKGNLFKAEATNKEDHDDPVYPIN